MKQVYYKACHHPFGDGVGGRESKAARLAYLYKGFEWWSCLCGSCGSWDCACSDVALVDGRSDRGSSSRTGVVPSIWTRADRTVVNLTSNILWTKFGHLIMLFDTQNQPGRGIPHGVGNRVGLAILGRRFKIGLSEIGRQAHLRL